MLYKNMNKCINKFIFSQGYQYINRNTGRGRKMIYTDEERKEKNRHHSLAWYHKQSKEYKAEMSRIKVKKYHKKKEYEKQQKILKNWY